MKRILLLLILFLASLAQAATNGAPITDNAYKLDLSQTVVVGSARKIALGGAYAAIPSGITGIADNPSVVAVRAPTSKGRGDWDATLNTAFLSGDDVDNNGIRSGDDYARHHIVTLGIMGQLEHYGLGIILTQQQVDLQQPVDPDRASFTNGEIVFGSTHYEGQFAWGVGFRGATAEITPVGKSSPKLLHLTGLGGSAGALWRPGNGPWRFGAVWKGPIKPEPGLPSTSTGPVIVNGLIVPNEVALPPEGTIGVSYEETSAHFWPGHGFLVSTDVRFIGAVQDAVGLESMTRQRVQISGEHTTPVWHLGGELEVFPKRLRLRAGTYREPSRFEDVKTRQHVTGGLQLGLFKMHLWGVKLISFSYGFDVASRYLNNAFSINFWK